MEAKYAATYRFPGSKTTVHIVAPLPMTDNEKEKRHREFHLTGLAAWNSLSDEERLKINLGVELTKILQRRLQCCIAETMLIERR